MEQLLEDFDAIQMPRSPYMIRDLVVDTKFTPEMKWAQMVLELSIAHDNLKIANVDYRLKEIELEELEEKSKGIKDKREKEKAKLEIEKKTTEREQLRRAALGASREYQFLFNMRSKGKEHYTREQLNESTVEEYRIRLETQAQFDILATGRVSAGNLEGLRQIGKVDKYANLINMQQPALVENQPDELETRYLEEWALRVRIIIPSEKPILDARDNPLNWVDRPNNIEFSAPNNIHTAPVAENYNAGFALAMKDPLCTHVLTVEDDQVLEQDSLIRLFDFALKNPWCCVWARYPKKEPVRKWAHIVMKWAHREFLVDDYQVHEVKTLAMGLTIYPIEALKKISFPFCKTTAHLSQDSYLSQKLRDAGVKLLVDTSIQIGHKDRVTGKIYWEVKRPEPKPMQVSEELAWMLEYVKGKKMILEIWTALGGTLCTMMKVADPKAHFVSIDMPDWPYGGEFGQPDIKEMRKRLQPWQKLSVIRFDSKHSSTLKEVKKILGKKKFDFALIDGDHEEKSVENDFILYEDLISWPLCFHDICHHGNPNVWVERFWNRIKKWKRYIEIIKDKTQGWWWIWVLLPTNK